ncbi:MAG: 3-hydroxyacyl-ACP dehydratase FabZ [Lachnospiraceae bacterium]|nr:3-hydroxyacyl-ACP dehydratase FabZ [Lachnospiraceae bacterium]MCR4678450.1 3-hydroxyacyl-ACP dehydratase FabZ [Lachnospiraceae bacterium]
MLNINEIYKKLPHRYPFLMVDRILEINKEESVIGIKNVTVNEPFFQGHFPDEPLMPAAMIVESMAQIGGFAFELDKERGYVVGVDKAKFKAKVIPGDTLTIECKKITRVGGLAKVKAVARVEGKEVASAEITYNFVSIEKI